MLLYLFIDNMRLCLCIKNNKNSFSDQHNCLMKKHVFQVDQIHFLLKFCLKNPTHYSSITLLFYALKITERLFHQSKLTEYMWLNAENHRRNHRE